MHLIPKHWYRRIRLPNFLVNTSQQRNSKQSSMLSRVNNDAGSRLRRAKSSSSTHQKFAGPPAILIDTGYAEVAAAEAFHRAYPQAPEAARPRRRGSRRSEGSHFDNNRRKVAHRLSVVPAHAPDPVSARSSNLPDTPYRSALEALNDSTLSDISESRISSTSRRQTRDLQTDDDIKAAAWDAYLQGFQKKEIHEKKSFVDPIRRRFTKSPVPMPSIQFDNSVPPYNCASDSEDLYSTMPSIEIPPIQIPKPGASMKLRKKRAVSDSLKEKFKRLLGRPKRTQSQFPVQHVEAKNLHFDVYKTEEDSTSVGPEFSVSLPRSPFSSLGACSNTKSRVTSWSNSTNSAHGKRLPSIEESIATEQPSYVSKVSSPSLLGRKLRLPKRRSSQTGLFRTSDDNHSLYTALRKRIDGSKGSTNSKGFTNAVVTPAILVEDSTAKQTNVLHAKSPVSAPTADTIRAVTSDEATPEPPTRPAPSPPANVTRKSSWWSLAISKNNHGSARGTKSLRMKNHFPSGPTAPSKEQIATRIEKTKNRWQSALEDHSPSVSQARDYCLKGVNPYRLGALEDRDVSNSLPGMAQHDVPAGPLANGADRHDIRHHVISPSVYSRASECRSASPDAGLDGMFITITGREVKRYPLDSPPRPINTSTYVPKASHEWKAWLSKELEDLNMASAPEELNLSGKRCSPCSTPDVLAGPGSGPAIQPPKARRPGLRSRSSSVMNERYPMIDTGRPPSRTSGQKTNPSSAKSSGQRTASGSAPSESENTSSQSDRLTDTDQMIPPARSKLREHQSTSALSNGRSKLAARAARHNYVLTSTESDSAGREDTIKAPKSALDLRATYRSNRSLEPADINIRRKPAASPMFEDHTLHKISEGPYAAETRSQKENATSSIDGMTIPPSYTRTRTSPGQRMVDDFLNSRKGMGNSSPVFI